MKKKILIADDEAGRRLVCDFLKNARDLRLSGPPTVTSHKKFLECGDIDLVICDIMMPGADGWEVCKRIRESADVPILILTARSQEFDELMSFESGADDFVTKPFSPVVLVKRVQALLKRSEGKKAETALSSRLDGPTIDLPAHTVTLGGASLDLTIKKEYNILCEARLNINRIYSEINCP